MRRTHLRGHGNISKRLLIHVGAFNLSLIASIRSSEVRPWENVRGPDLRKLPFPYCNSILETAIWSPSMFPVTATLISDFLVSPAMNFLAC